MVSTSQVSVHLRIVPSSVLQGVYRGARLCHTNRTTNFSLADTITEQVRTDYSFSLLTLSLSCSVHFSHIASPSVTPLSLHLVLLLFFFFSFLFGFFHSRLCHHCVTVVMAAHLITTTTTTDRFVSSAVDTFVLSKQIFNIVHLFLDQHLDLSLNYVTLRFIQAHISWLMFTLVILLRS